MMVFRHDSWGSVFSNDFIWPKPLIIVAIIGIAWLVFALILTSQLFSNVQAQEYTQVLKWGNYGRAASKFSWPTAIAIDSSTGNVYVADTVNNRIQAFSSNGTFITAWGDIGRNNGSFNQPEGIAVGQQGNVYVADTVNNRIQAFSSNGTFITAWGDIGRNNGLFNQPEGIAVDSSTGNVYVADTGNNRIQAFSSNGTFITAWGRYGLVNGLFNQPEGIAVDSSTGNVYVADTGNNRIQAFSSNGTFKHEFGDFGIINSTFRFPEGIAVDSSTGNVYVADTGNNRIQAFSSNGTFIIQWGKFGLEDFRFPEGIAVDSSTGNVYVADTANHKIHNYASYVSPFVYTGFNSSEGTIFSNDTNLRISLVYEGLKLPSAISFMNSSDILVLEKVNNTIMRILDGQMLDEPVLDLGNNTKIKGCVCGIAISRNDNGTSYAFLYYYLAEVTKEDGTTKLVNSLYRYDIDNGKFTNPKLLFEIPSSLEGIHHGGKLMIGPDKNVYLTIGDINGRETKAQNIKNGSLPDGSSGILRFTQDGEPVGGGLLGHTPPLDKYYAYGIRNSFGLDFDPMTGNIWITDNGPSYGDELNLVMQGFNGGWKKVMGMSQLADGFNSSDLEQFGGIGKYYDPQFEWLPSIGVTDVAFFASDQLGEQYENNLFVGDINSGYLYRFQLNESRTGLLLNGSLTDKIANNEIETQQAAFAKFSAGITDLHVGPDGLLYVVTSNGKILRLEPLPASGLSSLDASE
jgi:glucose/arabinose dehydrogenase/DNA-binding beta-propeller fold protein YncE